MPSITSAKMARSSSVEPAAASPGATGGSSGVAAGGKRGGEAGGAGVPSEARQQPVQLQPSTFAIVSQVKDTLSAAHDSLGSHRRSHGSSGCWPAEAGRLQSSRPMTTADTGANGVGWRVALLPIRLTVASSVATAAAGCNDFVDGSSCGQVAGKRGAGAAGAGCEGGAARAAARRSPPLRRRRVCVIAGLRVSGMPASTGHREQSGAKSLRLKDFAGGRAGVPHQNAG